MNNILKALTYITILCLPLVGFSQSSESSVLKSGKWYRIKVTETNIYKLSYEDLKSIGFEAPENIRIYGNGGNQLSYRNYENNLEDLKEVPIFQFLGSDNVFGPGDYYLFYGEGIVSWNFNSSSKMFIPKLHEYALCNYYFVTSSFGSGKKIQQIDYSSQVPNKTVNSYTWRDYHEKELYNLGNSGKLWFGDRFDDRDFSRTFTIPGLITDSILNLYAGIAVRSSSNKEAILSINNQSIATLTFSGVNLESEYDDLAKVQNKFYSFNTNDENVSIGVSLKSATVSDRAYVDKMILNAKCSLELQKGILFFREPLSVFDGNITRYKISNVNSNTQVWDITEHNNVSSIRTTINSDKLVFIAPSSELLEYVALDITAEFPRPILADKSLTELGWIENQDLHGAVPPELLIVTHPLFIKQADELADLHREQDNMTVLVVTTQQVYNEFSSGKPDISAIRNYVRLLYKNSTDANKLKYLLLFGDGSYDNRTINDINPNYIPTFQSDNSMSYTLTYVTDDFYAMLDSTEWNGNGNLEIGVGRLPVYWDKADEDKIAQALVDKIKSYYNAESMKDWRNQVIFLSDDAENGGDMSFVSDSDSLTRIIENRAPSMNISKIYLDAYQQISTSTGASYPAVETELHRTLNKGALVFNYMGHGGENGITQEKVFQRSDIENLKNGPYYPLFITATCQVSRFDNVIIESVDNYSRKISAGEAALLNPYGGAIALYTTTRVVFQDSNFMLSRDILNLLFDKDENNKRYKLGDIFRLAKNNSKSSEVNEFKFSLLGDPAITLTYGEYLVITDSVNSFPASESNDTANALGIMRVGGYVAYDDSTIINDFNGIVQVSVFDKEYVQSTLANDSHASIMEFTLQDKLLFHGKASVINGRFSFEFKAPKDISYNFGKGKISYYAQNGVIDAKGYFDNFYIGGTDPFAVPDLDGPEIELFMNDKNFVDGGITNNEPVLLAYITDENGINTTGNGIGHDLSAVLDNNFSKRYTLNDYFESDLDSYNSGTAYYQFSELESGTHTLIVKAWDIYNNSSEKSIGFYVKDVDDLIINKLFNYPNPMTDYTSFQYSHNIPGIHDVTIDIYDLSGRLIHSIKNTQTETGFVSEPIVFERNSSGFNEISPGVYPYTLRLKVSNEYDNSEFESIQSGRLIIIP